MLRCVGVGAKHRKSRRIAGGPWCLRWIVVALLMVAGCGRNAPVLHQEIEVQLVRATQGARGEQLPAARIDALVKAPFAAAGRFSRGRETGVRGALWFDVATTGPGMRRVELSLSIADPTSVRGGGTLDAMVTVDSDATGGETEDDAVRAALSLALGILDAQVALARGEESRVPGRFRAAAT